MKSSDIRNLFIEKYKKGELAENKTVEIINASFIADEPTIFGELNKDYADREIEWYEKQSLNVNDIPGETPKIWKQIASEKGMINSNYGWCALSWENGNQLSNAVKALIHDKNSRQASMIYIRPSMHTDAKIEGMSDFMCTYATQLMIRDGKLHYIVYMRSNDAVFGYKNDRYWHDHVFNKAYGLLKDCYKDLKKGDLYWNAASIHVYPRHFYLIEKLL